MFVVSMDLVFVCLIQGSMLSGSPYWVGSSVLPPEGGSGIPRSFEWQQIIWEVLDGYSCQFLMSPGL